jgi:thiol-disulfide isomerase/thioredoxin
MSPLLLLALAEPAADARDRTKGCMTVAEGEALAARVAALEDQAARLASAGAAPTTEDEEAARVLYTQIQAAVSVGDYALAKQLLAQLEAEYGNTTVWTRGGQTLSTELAIVGKPAMLEKAISWFQGEAKLGDGVTVLVFWEAWCPHCEREVPKLQTRYAKLHDRGLDVVGITRVTKSSTDEKVKAFLQEHAITFPIAKESGTMSDYYAVRGIPAAAVVKDGTIIWRGHPGRLTDEMFEAWL